MPADTADPVSVLQRIRDLAADARDASPEHLRATLDEIAELASQRFGDTPTLSDAPQTENQSL